MIWGSRVSLAMGKWVFFKSSNFILKGVKMKSLYVFQGVTLLSSAVSTSTCHWKIRVCDRHGHMSKSRGLDFSIGNPLKCVKDAYLEDDEHWVFVFKHWCELIIKARDYLYAKKISWLHLDNKFFKFVVLCVLGTVCHQTYGITPLQNDITRLVNQTFFRESLVHAL